MSFLSDLFSVAPCPAEARHEVDSLLQELFQIGKEDDFLSEHPGGKFDVHCHNVRTRAIGKRLDTLGGLPLMEWARKKVNKKLGKSLSAHLDYAWSEIGKWMP
jgi:hypothetical protein